MAAQSVYYFTSAVSLGAPSRQVAFVTPTGNFGDAFAGYAARRMGLDIAGITLAVNSNDILARALKDGRYATGEVTATSSPAMDIQVASNFERLYFEASRRDGVETARAFEAFAREGAIDLPPQTLAYMRDDFSGEAVSEDETARTILATFNQTGELLDPHTAVGLAAARPHAAGRGSARGAVHRPPGQVPRSRARRHRLRARPARPIPRPVRPARAHRPLGAGHRGGEDLYPPLRRWRSPSLSPRIHRLPNGVRVVADPMGGLSSFALSVVVRGGARWEDEATNGWSHLLEHMVFKGAGARSARAIVEDIEADGGQINAATGHERTSFQVRALAGSLPMAMDVLADLVRRPTLAEGDLDQEKQVIGQEIAEAADQPDDKVFELAQAHAFAGQPLGRAILGTPHSIGGATRDTLSAFHRGLYAPERLVVSAAGALDEDELLALAEAAFGDMTPGSARSEPPPARFVGGAEAEVRKLEQAHLVLLREGVGVSDPDYFAMRLFAEILGGGMSSRLFQVVREDLGLAYAVDAWSENHEDTGLFGVYCGSSAADAPRAARVIAEQIAGLAEAPTAAELSRARAQAKASLFMGRESPLARAEQAAAQLLLFDRLIGPDELGRRIEAVTLDDLRRVGAGVAGAERQALAVLGPRRAAAALDVFAPARAA